MPDSSEPQAPEYRSVLTRLREHARRMPDKACLVSIDQGSEITWGGLHAACNQVAGALAARKIRANDRVVVLTDNSLENLILYYGVQRYGATSGTRHWPVQESWQPARLNRQPGRDQPSSDPAHPAHPSC